MFKACLLQSLLSLVTLVFSSCSISSHKPGHLWLTVCLISFYNVFIFSNYSGFTNFGASLLHISSNLLCQTVETLLISAFFGNFICRWGWKKVRPLSESQVSNNLLSVTILFQKEFSWRPVVVLFIIPSHTIYSHNTPFCYLCNFK